MAGVLAFVHMKAKQVSVLSDSACHFSNFALGGILLKPFWYASMY